MYEVTDEIKAEMTEMVKWALDDMKTNPIFLEENGAISSAYIGKAYNLVPSGKFYTFWAPGNSTESERLADELYLEALSQIAEEHDCYVESSEDDPTDMYISQSSDKCSLIIGDETYHNVTLHNVWCGEVTFLNGDEEITVDMDEIDIIWIEEEV